MEENKEKTFFDNLVEETTEQYLDSAYDLEEFLYKTEVPARVTYGEAFELYMTMIHNATDGEFYMLLPTTEEDKLYAENLLTGNHKTINANSIEYDTD